MHTYTGESGRYSFSVFYVIFAPVKNLEIRFRIS